MYQNILVYINELLAEIGVSRARFKGKEYVNRFADSKY